MNEPKHLDVLEDIEAVVAKFWREYPNMTNYNVMRAYDAAITYFGALAREHTPKPHGLTGLEENLFLSIKAIGENRVGRGPDAEAQAAITPIPLEDMVACFRKLRKSVDFWTEQGGRQGYMEFIQRFLP